MLKEIVISHLQEEFKEIKMNGIIVVDTERVIKWSKTEEGVWTIELVSDTENPDSDGHTNLRLETLLQEMSYTEE